MITGLDISGSMYPSNTEAPQGRKEWRQEVDTSHISKITWKRAL
jgi:hypothetical protein